MRRSPQDGDDCDVRRRTRSSAAARSSDWTARPKINRAKRRWSSPSASAEPSATCRMSSSSRGARSVDGIRRCPFMQAYIAAAWWCEVAAPQARRSTAPSVSVTTPAEAIWIGSTAANAGPTKRIRHIRDGRRDSSPPAPKVQPHQRANGCAAGERRVKGSCVHPTHGFANQRFHSRLALASVAGPFLRTPDATPRRAGGLPRRDTSRSSALPPRARRARA